MRKVCLSLVLFSCGVIHAASFDCAKAKTPQEKAICASPQLSAADNRMAAAYKALLIAAPAEMKAQILDGQRDWIRGMAVQCPDNLDLPLRMAPAEFRSFKLVHCLLNYENQRINVLEHTAMRAGDITFIWQSVNLPLSGDSVASQANTPSGKDSEDAGTLKASWPQAASKSPAWVAWNEAIEAAAKNIASATGIGAKGEWSPETGMDTDVSVTVNSATDQLISATVMNIWYGHGAAHRNESFIQFNWLLRERRELKAEDLFLANTKWVDMLAAVCDRSARAQLGEMYSDNPPPGTIPKEMIGIVSSPESWQIDASGITIAFEPYAIGCHACTPGPVTVSWSDLKPYLNPRFKIPAN